MPDRYVSQFPDYRRWGRKRIWIGNPRDYFVKHPQRGFDIGANVRAHHRVDGVRYPIWGNSIGCFDREYNQDDPYIYFAGDSFTWGYAPFEKKFGSLIEDRTGVRILKCGVTHTGQRHQYEKFRDIVGKIGRLPKVLFVFYYWNDYVNDYAHPHSTVYDGWLLDNVAVDENSRLVRITDQELADNMAQLLRKAKLDEEPAMTPWGGIRRVLLHYSVTANLMVWLKKQVSGKRQLPAVPHAGNEPARAPVRFESKSSKHLHIYSLLMSEKSSWFTNNPMADENRSALLKFRDFAERNELPLVVVLLPVTPRHARGAEGFNTEHYREVRDFLDAERIRFVDLNLRFREKEWKANELYWRSDFHFNIAGNRAVAKILIEEFPELLSK